MAVEDAVVALVVAVDELEGLTVVDVAAVGLRISLLVPFCHEIENILTGIESSNHSQMSN